MRGLRMLRQTEERGSGYGLCAGARSNQVSGCPEACLHGCNHGGEAIAERLRFSEQPGQGADLRGHKSDVLRDHGGGSSDTYQVANIAVIEPYNGQCVDAGGEGLRADGSLSECSGIELLRLKQGVRDVVHGAGGVGVGVDTATGSR